MLVCASYIGAAWRLWSSPRGSSSAEASAACSNKGAGGHYTAMLAPILDFAIRGAIWCKSPLCARCEHSLTRFPISIPSPRLTPRTRPQIKEKQMRRASPAATTTPAR